MSNLLDLYMEYVEETESPRAFHKWACISMVSSLLERKTWMQWGDAKVYGNLNIILTGRPGLGKSQAMHKSKKFLDLVDTKFCADVTSARDIAQQLHEIEAESIIPGMGARDLKPHASMTIFIDELEVFIGNKMKNNDMIALLLRLFDCAPHKESFKQAKGAEFKRPYVPLLGGTTPESLKRCLDISAAGDGFASRMIFVWADAIHKEVPIPRFSSNTNLVDQITENARNIKCVHGAWHLTDGAVAFWKEWYTGFKRNKKMDVDSFLVNWYERKNIFTLKLAMIASAMENKDLSNPANMLVSEDHLKTALNWLGEIEQDMAKAFSLIGSNEYLREMNIIGDTVKRHQRITHANLLRAVKRDVSPIKFDQIVETLIRSGELKRESISPGNVSDVNYVWLG